VKKTAVLLLMILCLQLPISSAAAETSTYEDYAECLSKLGVFVGTGNGFELDRSPTRIEGLIMLIRLIGAENEAKSTDGKDLPFTDVPKWAAGYVAYAYENGLTNGISNSRFGSSNAMESKAYITFLLRSLGYNDQAGDFSYGNSLNFAEGIKLLSSSMYSVLKDEPFLRAYIAKTSYDALRMPYKGENTLLIDRLISGGKLDKATGETFKKTILSEPSRITAGGEPVAVEANMESVVMLSCYTDYTDDEYGPDIGSGVIVSSDGKIVTNWHVLEDAYDIDVTFNDGSVYDGDVYVLDYNEDLDLAVLKINKTGLKPATIGDSGKVRIGDPIVTIGSPYGYFNTVTKGIVSAIRSDSIQIDAAINPGNSGGGLFNKDGKLVGIPNSAIFLADNIGFAIPSNKLTAVGGNQKILLKDYYAMHAEPLPPAPTGLKLIYETGTTALLNWNPVEGASYYVYCKGPEDDDYNYLDMAEHGINYSYLATDLVPGQRYSFKVSSDLDGQESELSPELTFVKGQGTREVGAFDLYYSQFPGIPDFGKLLGISPYQTERNQFYYKIQRTDESVSMILDYGLLMEDCGFTFAGSTTAADGTITDTSRNETLGKSISMIGKSLSDDEYIIRIKID
jgi:Trypsin-like serine proteases, typically periplasmic, contain C-terminal PDZ domain